MFFIKNCGEVVGVRLVRDKNSARCTGIGYVEFEDSASILSALNLNGIEYEGRQLRISKVLKKNKVCFIFIKIFFFAQCII